jgi:AraC family transcriptional regulator
MAMLQFSSSARDTVDRPLQTHLSVPRSGREVRATSEGLGWGSLFVSLQHEEPESIACESIKDYFLVVQLRGQARLTLNISGQSMQKRSSVGSCSLFVRNEPFSIQIGDPHDTAHIYLRSELLDRVRDERCAAGAHKPTLESFFGVTEPLLEQLAIGCVRALRQRDASSGLYVDHLAWAMAAHLVESQSDGGSIRPRTERGGLTNRQFRRVEAYIEAHLASNVRVGDLATAAGLSPVYFCQQFKLLTGIPPFRYLRLARIERAKRLLAADELPIAELALKCGFCHQEHLTHAFKTECGTTPALYRRLHRRNGLTRNCAYPAASAR